MEEVVRICDYCGRMLAEGEGTPVDDELLCDDCVEEHCVTCDHCGETIWEQNSVSDEDTCLCQDCFDAHYYRCESCGQIVPESLVCWHSDLPYCERCFDEFEDEIEEYGYKPTPMKCRTISTPCSTHTIGINWDYAKWWMEDEREELLLEYCGTFGVSEEEVELLLEVGYDPDEIEELLMDTAAMEEAISEAKTLLQCEA